MRSNIRMLACLAALIVTPLVAGCVAYTPAPGPGYYSNGYYYGPGYYGPAYYGDVHVHVR